MSDEPRFVTDEILELKLAALRSSLTSSLTLRMVVIVMGGGALDKQIGTLAALPIAGAGFLLLVAKPLAALLFRH